MCQRLPHAGAGGDPRTSEPRATESKRPRSRRPGLHGAPARQRHTIRPCVPSNNGAAWGCAHRPRATPSATRPPRHRRQGPPAAHARPQAARRARHDSHNGPACPPSWPPASHKAAVFDMASCKPPYIGQASGRGWPAEILFRFCGFCAGQGPLCRTQTAAALRRAHGGRASTGPTGDATRFATQRALSRGRMRSCDTLSRASKPQPPSPSPGCPP